MPRIEHIIEGDTSALADQEATGGRYAGPKPPKGIYKGTVRFLKLRGTKEGKSFVPKKNKNGDYMISGAVSLKGTKGGKYDGYLVNFNQNISTQGAPFVNQMLNSMFGGSEKIRKEFWNKKIFVGVDLDGMITHVGKARYTDNSIDVVISTKDGKDNNGSPELQIGAWLSAKALDTDTDSDEDEDDEDLEFEDDGDEEDEDLEDDAEEADEDADEDDFDEAEEDEDDGDEGDEDEDQEDEDNGEEEAESAGWDRSERRGLLAELNRKELVAVCKERGIKGTKGVSDEDLIEKVLDAEESDPPF